MSFFVFLSFFSLSVMSQDYSLYRPENDHYRSYTRQELMDRMGPNSELLPFYQCNGRDEQDFLWPALRKNPRGDSLQIKIPKMEERFIYREGSFYQLNGEPQSELSFEFLHDVSLALQKIETMPEGRALLRELEHSFFPLTIALGGNMFNPKDDEGRSYRGIYRATSIGIFEQGRMTSEEVPFNNFGAGGVVAWNPKLEGIPSHVSLAHEMYHAFDSIRGLLDLRFVQGDHYEFVSMSEYRAVYFENLVRHFSGAPYRTHYGQDQSGPGVLDEQGMPRKMPSPCLP